MTNFPEIHAALCAPFPPNEVFELSKGGTRFAYIKAPSVMRRLDDVLGWENWWDSYTPGDDAVLCRLTICLPDGRTITKEDAGAYAGMADEGDDEKSGLSDALKRAAVKFGVGRYLHPCVGGGRPDRAPAPAAATAGPPRRARDQLAAPGAIPTGLPTTGQTFYRWVKEREDYHQVGLFKYLNGWGKAHGCPGRMVDWSPEQVRAGHAEALRKLAAAGAGPDTPRPAHQNAPPHVLDLTRWANRYGLIFQVRAFGDEHGYPARYEDWTAAQCSAAHDTVRAEHADRAALTEALAN